MGSTPIWKDSAKSDLSNARANDLLNEILAKYPMEAEFDKILLGYVNLGTEMPEQTGEAEPAPEPVEGDGNVWIIAGVSAALLAAAAFVWRRKEL